MAFLLGEKVSTGGRMFNWNLYPQQEHSSMKQYKFWQLAIDFRVEYSSKIQ